MKKVFAFLVLFAIGAGAAAEEGMWMPVQVPSLAKSLQALGAEIDPQRLGDLGSYPLGAVARLGGCSASFVSPDGLIITNYHCAYSSVQLSSTVERNLLENGFLARSHEDELPGSLGLRVLVVEGIEDVTARVVEGLDGAGGERSKKIDERREALVSDCEKEPGHRCQVAAFYGGVRYSLIRQLELRDVRLVYAPPAGIGRYGGDADNFTWPQQRGDFAFFRAYAGDGKPYRPAHHLKVARTPLQEGDFILVPGFPNATNRYRLSSEVENSFLWHYPRLIESYETWLRVIRGAVKGRPDAGLKYAGFDAGLNNSLTFARGLVDSFAGSGLLERKLALEKDLEAWVSADPGRKARFGDVVAELRELFARKQETRELERRYHLATRSTLLGTARQLYQLAKGQASPQEREEARAGLEKSSHNFDARVDRAVWTAFLLDYHRLPAGQRVASLDRWFGLKPGRPAEAKIERVLDRMYSRTRLDEINQAFELTGASAEAIEASQDPFLELAGRLDEHDRAQDEREKESSGALRALYARYMEALVGFMESRGEVLYPDANGTLRVAFGTVKGYTTAKGIVQEPFTTAQDIVRTTTGAEPFNTPTAALAALRQRRFGTYRDPRLGILPVNFLGTVDVTGGNSGAPTLNARGELVGLLFDINQEGIISSWDYRVARTRSVHLDIRYVLWLLDEVEHARELLAEMGVPAAGEIVAGTGAK